MKRRLLTSIKGIRMEGSFENRQKKKCIRDVPRKIGMDLSMMSRGRGIHQSDCLDPVKRKNWTFACTAPHGNPTTRKLRFRRSILLEQVVMMVTRETVLRENRFGASNSIYACICLACVFLACMDEAYVCTIILYICLHTGKPPHEICLHICTIIRYIPITPLIIRYIHMYVRSFAIYVCIPYMHTRISLCSVLNH